MTKMSSPICFITAFILAILTGLVLPVPAGAAPASMLVSKVATSKPMMALTFDFGSDAGNLSSIMQVLTDQQVGCTFFVTGESAISAPDAIRSVTSQGHELGNHSWSHPYFTQIPPTQMRDEIIRTEDAIASITGQSPRKYFRPPYGDYNSAVLEAVGETGYPYTVMWTIDTLDWQGIDAATIRRKVIAQAAPGAIVLMHVSDGAANTPAALPGMITSLRDKGYQLVTVSQLLGAATSARTYVVRAGDTLYRIATRFGVTVAGIVAANNIANPDLIYIGQVLMIPGTSDVPSRTTYTVRAGDTLYRIATRFGVTVAGIVAANNIANPDLIYIGQVLMIP